MFGRFGLQRGAALAAGWSSDDSLRPFFLAAVTASLAAA
jgi:hypothetical protein